MTKILIAAAAMVIGSGAASAAATGGQPASNGKPVVYCFQVEGTGSRIVRTVCQTEKQWNHEAVEIVRK